MTEEIITFSHRKTIDLSNIYGDQILDFNNVIETEYKKLIAQGTFIAKTNKAASFRAINSLEIQRLQSKIDEEKRLKPHRDILSGLNGKRKKENLSFELQRVSFENIRESQNNIQTRPFIPNSIPTNSKFEMTPSFHFMELMNSNKNEEICQESEQQLINNLLLLTCFAAISSNQDSGNCETECDDSSVSGKSLHSSKTCEVNLAMSSKSKKIKKINTCGHPDREHYAKNMCNTCYHKFGRNKKPWRCSHDKLYAHGLCQNCYINTYNQKKKKGKNDEEDFERSVEKSPISSASTIDYFLDSSLDN